MQSILPDNYKLPDISQLTIEQKIAQVLGFVVVPWKYETWKTRKPSEFNALEKFIAAYGIGQIHFGYGSLEQRLDCIEHLQQLALEKSGIPIFFGADCEQGISYHCMFGTELPWQMAIGATQNTDYAYWAGVITGKEARASGLDIVFGPVADVITNTKNSIISIRSFGSDPNMVSEFVVNYVRGCQEQGVIATLKHFPGHGQVTEDSHLTLPIDSSDLSFIEQYHLPPFIAGIKAGAKAIMTAHTVLSCVDRIPATISHPIMTGLLREKLGFQGLIVTDSMQMNAISQCMPQPVEYYAVEAIKAGCDIALHPGQCEIIMDIFKKALDEGRLTEAALDLAVQHVFAAKQWVLPYQIHPDETIAEEFFQDQNRIDMAETMAMSSVSVMPGSSFETLPNCACDIVSIIEDEQHNPCLKPLFVDILLEHRPQSSAYKIMENMSDAKWNQLLGQMQDTQRPIVLALFCGSLWFNGRTFLPADLMEDIMRLSKNRLVHSTIIFGCPYMAKNLPGKVKYCAYGATTSAQKAGAAVILGHYPAKGKLPVIWEDRDNMVW